MSVEASKAEAAPGCRGGSRIKSMTRWVVGNPESNDRTVLFLEETCAEAESNHLPKLLSLMREAFRSRHYSPRTEQTYCGRVRRIIVFHRLRHPEGGYETRTVRELPGHKDVRATIYTHILNRGGRGDRSPVDKSVSWAAMMTNGRIQCCEVKHDA